MLKAKCINKIRNKNNIIEKYTLQDGTGETITVTSKQLKDAIKAGKIDVINLKLTSGNRLIDRSITEKISGYKELSSEQPKEVSEKQYNKSVMLGVAPILNDNGAVIGINGKRVIFTDNTMKISKNINAIDTVAMFNGNNKFTKTLNHFDIELCFKEIIINNPCVVTYIGGLNNEGIVLLAETIHINHDLIELSTVDEVFKILKSQKDKRTYNDIFRILINPSKGKLSNDDIYDRTVKILKRQKKSQENARRLYDLAVYLEFIYCMWLSTGKTDNRYKEISDIYFSEYNDKIKYSFYNSSYINILSYLDEYRIKEIKQELK